MKQIIELYGIYPLFCEHGFIIMRENKNTCIRNNVSFICLFRNNCLTFTLKILDIC